MKKIFLMIAVSVCFAACDAEIKVNEKKLDEAGEKLQNTVETGVDTIGSKLKKLKEKIKERKRDTIII
ncbi:MAG: hypothetical protein JWQ40_3532 [Segetibacter sp.]|nr:hypothetical protein [Segetibacter sp.]